MKKVKTLLNDDSDGEEAEEGLDESVEEVRREFLSSGNAP